jgi:hypothetical protein
MGQLALDLREAQMLMGELAALRAGPCGAAEKRKAHVVAMTVHLDLAPKTRTLV